MATSADIRGTQTEKNIVTSYLAESAAYSRYTFYAAQANKEKYYPIEQIFKATAANELHHAKIYFKYLQGGKVEVPMNIDSGVIGTTAENLATAAAEELSEGVDMYTGFAETARKEGFDDIASHFDAIASIEAMHHKRFLYWEKLVDTGTVWKREKPIRWQCLVCGFEYEGTEPPMPACPSCNHPYQYFMPAAAEVSAEGI